MENKLISMTNKELIEELESRMTKLAVHNNELYREYMHPKDGIRNDIHDEGLRGCMLLCGKDLEKFYKFIYSYRRRSTEFLFGKTKVFRRVKNRMILKNLYEITKRTVTFDQIMKSWTNGK